MARRLLYVSAYVLVFLVAFGLGAASSQQSPPQDNKGITFPKIASLDLGPEIDGMHGRQLRLRLVEFAPGGIVGIHTHKDRPAAVYVLKGTLTEYREGGYVKEWREGEMFTEGKDVTHWAENRGSTPLVLVAADIPKQ